MQMQYIKWHAKMMVNFLAKQMKNTQTSHDIKKGVFHICWWKKMEAYKKGI